ncbi:unnamed protein product [Dovyalis caffra]|uniref:RNase H type-1 domain-containing protein n=1 Tax=Dovyalis caffra TaxID=77055 RepID=A0AAV1SDX5_9ROSI|nr:unnamed protein product [Dovyalis caffra]
MGTGHESGAGTSTRFSGSWKPRTWLISFKSRFWKIWPMVGSLGKLVNDLNRPDISNLPACICRQIWNSRKGFVKENLGIDPLIIAQKAKYFDAEFQSARIPSTTAAQANICRQVQAVKWTRPEHCELKLNCDISYVQGSSYAGTGIVYRDSNGALIDGSGLVFNCRSAAPGEALAIRDFK